MLAAMSPILLLGSFFGFKMGGDARRSAQQRESVATFWQIVAGSLAAFVVLPFLVLLVIKLMGVDFSGDFRQRVMNGMTIWLGLMYVVVPAALILWGWQRRRKFRSLATAEPENAVSAPRKKRLLPWVIIAMIGSAGLLIMVLADTNKQVNRVAAVEIQKMVMDGTAKQAKYFCIIQFQSGVSNFWITMQQDGKEVNYSAQVDDTTLALVKAQRIKCPTYIQAAILRYLVARQIFAGVLHFHPGGRGVILLRRPGNSVRRKWMRSKVKIATGGASGKKVFGTALRWECSR